MEIAKIQSTGSSNKYRRNIYVCRAAEGVGER